MSAQADFQKRAIDEAVEALTKRLRERDAAEPGQREPADMFARRFMQDMNGRGWRLTPAGRVNPLARRPPDDPAAATQRGAALARNLLPQAVRDRHRRPVMSPARPAHEQPGAIPAAVPYDQYGNLLQSTAGVDADSIDWRKPASFTLPLRLHNTHGLRGITRPITWKDPHGPATFPMFPDDLGRTIKNTIIDHGLVIGEWVPLVRRDQYGIGLKGFHEQEEPAPEPAPASPAEEAAARYIDRERAVQIVIETLALPGAELHPDIATVIDRIREDRHQ